MSKGRTWYPLTGNVATTRRAPARAAARRVPVDPLTGPKQALAGQVVTMNGTFTVHRDAVVYMDQGAIVAVLPKGRPAPTGFSGVQVVRTNGTIFPGLIELHNHLSYNALPLWTPVPQKFEHRGQWPGHKDYRPLVSGPMSVIGKHKDRNGKYALLPALIRYVECKCLLGGVTTSQGVKLYSNAGIQRFYRGVVRNVEQTDEADLPEAQGRIPDLDAKTAKGFLSRLNKEDSCFLLHLSEGVTDPASPYSAARKHFLAMEVAPDEWALNHNFTGIHAAGLLPNDFKVLARYKSSIVWSPLSNLLLYGGTARVEAAKKAGVTIGLGSDWSPTGSKNLLGELKVAWLYNKHHLNTLFAPREIVAMATSNAASILKWQDKLGVIKAGARADLLVIDSAAQDPYTALLNAAETDIQLVMINGVARYGTTTLMGSLAPGGEAIKVGGKARKVYLQQATADPDVDQVTLAKATTQLRKALKDIAKLAKAAAAPQRVAARRPLDAPAPVEWALALDEICDCGVEFAPRLPYNGPNDHTGPDRAPSVARAAAPLADVLKPIVLDPLTVADDPDFLDRIELQPNIPAKVRRGLRAMY